MKAGEGRDGANGIAVCEQAAVFAERDKNEPDAELVQKLLRGFLIGNVSEEEGDLLVTDLYNVRLPQAPEHLLLCLRKIIPERPAEIGVEGNELSVLLCIRNGELRRRARRLVGQGERSEVQNACAVQKPCGDLVLAQTGVCAGLAGKGEVPVAVGVEGHERERCKNVRSLNHALRADPGLFQRAEQQLAEGIRADLADHARFRAEARQRGEKIRRSAAGVRGHDGISVRVRFLAGKIDQKLAESDHVIFRAHMFSPFDP